MDLVSLLAGGRRTPLAAVLLLPVIPAWALAPNMDGRLAASTASVPRDIPLKRDEVSPGNGPFWVAGVFLVILLVLSAFIVVFRKQPGSLMRALGKRKGAAMLDRITSQALTPHASVHAIRWNDEELLLGCTAQQVIVLARRPVTASSEVA